MRQHRNREKKLGRSKSHFDTPRSVNNFHSRFENVSSRMSRIFYHRGPRTIFSPPCHSLPSLACKPSAGHSTGSGYILIESSERGEKGVHPRESVFLLETTVPSVSYRVIREEEDIAWTISSWGTTRILFSPPSSQDLVYFLPRSGSPADRFTRFYETVYDFPADFISYYGAE